MSVTLTNGDDIFNGTAANETISALRGGDDVTGGGGADLINGGFGNDFLDGGIGNDTLFGDEDTDVLFGGVGADFIDGGEGNDRADGGADNDTVLGGVGGDNLAGGDGNDSLDGGVDNDFLDGGAGNDVVDGDTGDDRMVGGSGQDTLRGFTGDDVIYGDANGEERGTASGDIPLVTTAASTTIRSSGQSFGVSLTTLDATNGSTLAISGVVSTGRVTSSQFNVAYILDISGSTGSAFTGGTTVGDLNGDGQVNTVLDAEIDALRRLNADIATRFGGANVDVTVIAFDDVAFRPLFFGQAGTDSDFDGQLDVEEALRALPVRNGTNFEPPLQQAINFFNTAGAGNNFAFFLSDGFSGSSTNFLDEAALLRATPLSTVIRSVGVGSGADLSQLDALDDGLANNSAIRVLNPADLNSAVLGSPIAAATVDRVEVLLNGVVVQTIPGASLISTPLGLQYNAVLNGLSVSASDTVTVRAIATDPRATTVTTSQVVEQVLAGPNDDLVIGDTGNDILYGASGNDTVRGGTGDDIILGGEGNDRLVGGTGNDQLSGNNGRDTITGFAGDDEINGQGGIDRLLGGQGADNFVFGSIEDLGDVIVDFEVGIDRIDIGNLLDFVEYRGTDPLAEGVVRFVAAPGGTLIVFDQDGTAGPGAALLLAELRQVAPGDLGAGDFAFI